MRYIILVYFRYCISVVHVFLFFVCFLFLVYDDHRDLHVLTHSFPTRRSSDLFYASLGAIAGGGLCCWVGLDIPPLTYIQRLREIIPMTDFWIMLIKAPVFGILIGVTGCYEGMQVRQNAEEVGQRTTSAGVAAI